MSILIWGLVGIGALVVVWGTLKLDRLRERVLDQLSPGAQVGFLLAALVVAVLIKSDAAPRVWWVFAVAGVALLGWLVGVSLPGWRARKRRIQRKTLTVPNSVPVASAPVHASEIAVERRLRTFVDWLTTLTDHQWHQMVQRAHPGGIKGFGQRMRFRRAMRAAKSKCLPGENEAIAAYVWERLSHSAPDAGGRGLSELIDDRATIAEAAATAIMLTGRLGAADAETLSAPVRLLAPPEILKG